MQRKNIFNLTTVSNPATIQSFNITPPMTWGLININLHLHRKICFTRKLQTVIHPPLWVENASDIRTNYRSKVTIEECTNSRVWKSVILTYRWPSFWKTCLVRVSLKQTGKCKYLTDWLTDIQTCKQTQKTNEQPDRLVHRQTGW